MAIRKLNPKQQTEIIHAYKSGNFEQDELANMYGVSRTTIRNVLVDNGLLAAVARKTPEQLAMLEHLKMLGIGDVEKLRSVLRDITRSSAQRFYESLPLSERTAWFTQSVTKLDTNNTKHSDMLFTTEFLEAPNESNSANPTTKVQPI